MARRIAPYPVGDPLAFFAGRWGVRRHLVDGRSGQRGSFRGHADFLIEEGDGQPALRCVEEGELTWPGYQDWVRRVTRYQLSGLGRLVARFEDGTPFHDLDLRRGECAAVHSCGADRYRGRFLVSSSRRWRVCWEVSGPAKTLSLESRYLRLSGDEPTRQ